VTSDDARRLALSLPEAAEEPHHDLPSFRVRGRILATLPDDGHLRVMAGEPEILAAVAEDPEACAPFFWGKRLACVVVDLAKVHPGLLEELLIEAWLRKAPKSLAASSGLDARRSRPV